MSNVFLEPNFIRLCHPLDLAPEEIADEIERLIKRADAAEEARDAYKARAQRAEALLDTAARRDGLRIEEGEG